MQNSEHASNQTYQKSDIQATLLRQLDQLRQQYPERFSISIYVLAAVDETVDGKVEESFKQALTYYSGKRIILIPYNSGHFHWIGILIQFNSQEHIEQCEFIDPVIGSDFVPNKLQK
ncbi:unnamed protein product [Rotaria sp. Silwood2]|nr:unnamed protein product [Rotaria sp. Silwood2]CAF4017156.1 unnamed protein product [Rotaria sp. Silwood2]